MLFNPLTTNIPHHIQTNQFLYDGEQKKVRFTYHQELFRCHHLELIFRCKTKS